MGDLKKLDIALRRRDFEELDEAIKTERGIVEDQQHALKTALGVRQPAVALDQTDAQPPVQSRSQQYASVL